MRRTGRARLTLAPMERALVPTGLAIELPRPPQRGTGVRTQRLPSSTACGMANGVGVVDSDYRGELKVPWSIWQGSLHHSAR